MSTLDFETIRDIQYLKKCFPTLSTIVREPCGAFMFKKMLEEKYNYANAADLLNYENLTEIFINSKYFNHFLQLYEYSLHEVLPADFCLEKIIGKGAFGTVYAVTKKDTRKKYAWKQMKKTTLKTDSIDAAINEYNTLLTVKSPFVVQLKYAFNTEENIVFVMDLYENNLKQYKFSREHVKLIAAEILLGIEAFHEHNIIYRDLKLSNIVLDDAGHAHIIDLGLIKQLSLSRSYSTGLSGTRGYWAPEIVERKQYGLWADWWSFGVVLYELLKGNRPRCFCNQENTWCTFMSRSSYSPSKTFKQNLEFDSKYFCDESRDLISKLLNPKLHKRLGYDNSDEIKNHPYFAGVDFEKVVRGEISPPPAVCSIPNNSIYKESSNIDIKMTEEDETKFEKFSYQNPKIIQEELLEYMKNGPPLYKNCCCLMI